MRLSTIAVAAACAFYALLPLAAQAGTRMSTVSRVPAPGGFKDYCSSNSQASPCRQYEQDDTSEVRLTPPLREELDRTQKAVNQKMRYRLDVSEDIWTMSPASWQGDCEDYALTKREELIRLGWPAKALLLTLALTKNGEFHLVLTAVTSDGDLILDSLQQSVKGWDDPAFADYTWISRQSSEDPQRWTYPYSPGSTNT